MATRRPRQLSEDPSGSRSEAADQVLKDLAGLEQLQLMQLTLIREIQREVRERLANPST